MRDDNGPGVGRAGDVDHGDFGLVDGEGELVTVGSASARPKNDARAASAGPLALCGCQPVPARWAKSHATAPSSSGACGRTRARASTTRAVVSVALLIAWERPKLFQ